MFKHLYQRYLAWEARWYAPIADPANDAGMPGWYLQYTRDMSDVERQQWMDFYRRWYGWRALAFMFSPMLVGSLLAVLIHFGVAPTRFSLTELLLLGNALALTLAWAVVGAWFGYRNDKRRAERFGGNGLRRRLRLGGVGLSLPIGLLVGASVAIGMTFLRNGYAQELPRLLVKLPTLSLSLLLACLLIWVPYRLISRYRQQQHDGLMQQLQADAERERLARQLSEARLRLLEAQIEPHFLFNTLGAVQQLAEQGAPRAAALTGHLIQFLRSSLAEMRAEAVSLADDFALIEAYLTVMQARLGERLQFALALPANLAACQLPSMMLLTLVENAIKHGIEPALHGGSITVSATHSAGQLLVQVADSGQGLAASGSEGLGLANVRERLRLAYGEAARFELSEQPAGGVLASLHLPIASQPETRKEKR